MCRARVFLDERGSSVVSATQESQIERVWGMSRFLNAKSACLSFDVPHRDKRSKPRLVLQAERFALCRTEVLQRAEDVGLVTLMLAGYALVIAFCSPVRVQLDFLSPRDVLPLGSMPIRPIRGATCGLGYLGWYENERRGELWTCCFRYARTGRVTILDSLSHSLLHSKGLLTALSPCFRDCIVAVPISTDPNGSLPCGELNSLVLS